MSAIATTKKVCRLRPEYEVCKAGDALSDARASKTSIEPEVCISVSEAVRRAGEMYVRNTERYAKKNTTNIEKRTCKFA